MKSVLSWLLAITVGLLIGVVSYKGLLSGQRSSERVESSKSVYQVLLDEWGAEINGSDLERATRRMKSRSDLQGMGEGQLRDVSQAEAVKEKVEKHLYPWREDIHQPTRSKISKLLGRSPSTVNLKELSIRSVAVVTRPDGTVVRVADRPFSRRAHLFNRVKKRIRNNGESLSLLERRTQHFLKTKNDLVLEGKYSPILEHRDYFEVLRLDSVSGSGQKHFTSYRAVKKPFAQYLEGIR